MHSMSILILMCYPFKILLPHDVNKNVHMIYMKKMHNRQQNKCYHSVLKFDRSNKFDLRYYGQVKFTTAKIECSFEMGK